MRLKILSVQQAKAAVLQGLKPLGSEKLSLGECLGRELAEKIRAPYDYPLRDVSAMDGFAYHFQDARGGNPLRLSGERRAGDGPGAKLGKGTGVRIMTGAPLPPGADSVTPKEQAKVEGGKIFLSGKIKKWSHVRRQGEGIRRGKVLSLPKGPLTDRAMGYIATLGLGSLKVRRDPRVAVLVTGNELITPGENPGTFGVFESNGLMLESSLKEMGIPVTAIRVRDRASLLTVKVKQALASNDVVLVTGGVSVGESDATKEAFRRAGVAQVFWRVAQKPGGPLYFGRKGKKSVFGLPGNPAAVYSCFQLYVLPLLRKLQGRSLPRPAKIRLLHEVKPLGKKTFFVKAKLEGKKGRQGARVLGGQGSHLLESMALGDGLLEIPPGPKVLKEGTILDFYPFKEGSKCPDC